MQLLNEDLARAQVRARNIEAAEFNRAVRLANARRLQRRAQSASRRARRALALAAMP